MHRILFVCHGNICRSPMAEFIMKDIVQRSGRDDFIIGSCATSTEEIGCDIYLPAKRTLDLHGIQYETRMARQMTFDDYDKHDLIIAMDRNNIRNMSRFIKGDPDGKVSLMMDEVGRHIDVADPWYTGDFERTYDDISEACQALFSRLICEKK